MLKCTSGEYFMILSLLEILFTDLCLFLIIDVLVKIYKGYRCVCWFPRRVLDQRIVRESLGPEVLYLLFI
jgi:hypothetical protein